MILLPLFGSKGRRVLGCGYPGLNVGDDWLAKGVKLSYKYRARRDSCRESPLTWLWRHLWH